MARAIWTGSVSFGLVTIPVGLYSATREHTIHFHQYQRGTSDRIRNRRVNERTGKEVDFADIVKGREVDGELVLVERQELEDIAPGRSRSIDVERFVDLADIDPIYFQRTYWLAPAKDEHAHAYQLLTAAMTRTNRAGIATFVMRGKEYLVALRAEDGLLALETLYFPDEIRKPEDELDTLPGKEKPSRGKELEMATNLVESMTGPWRPTDFHDTYTRRVDQLIADKKQGREVRPGPEPPRDTDVVDLMSALERSVERAKGRRGRGKSETGGRKQRTPALGDMTKAELGALARELDIPGRSTMTRDELERAVGEAGQRRKKAS